MFTLEATYSDLQPLAGWLVVRICTVQYTIAGQMIMMDGMMADKTRGYVYVYYDYCALALCMILN